MLDRQRLHGLDFLRAAAIVSVFFYHYQDQFAHPAFMEAALQQWWVGVDLFFVLSGFLIASAIFREWEKTSAFSFNRFYIKRTFRIFPPFFFMVALYFLLPFAREAPSIAPLWKFFTFTQNIGLYQETQRAFSHAWSLCMEEQFYLLLPAITVVLLRKRLTTAYGWLLAASILVAMGSRFVTAHFLVHDYSSWVTWVYYAPHTRYDSLVFGVIAAWVSVFRPALWASLAARWKGLGILGGLLAGILIFWNPLNTPQTFTLFFFPAIGLAFVLLLISMVTGQWSLSKRAYSPIRFVADISYSAYLCHKMVIHVMQSQGEKLGIDPSGIEMLLLCLLLTGLCATAMYRWIERPSFTYRDRLLAKLA